MSTSLSNLLALLSLDDSGFKKGLDGALKESASFNTRLASLGGAVVVGGLALAAGAIAGVGTAAWNAGQTWDEAMDAIAIKTGATGPALQGLGQDFKSVFTSIPTDATTAANVIGLVNSQLGFTGPVLQDVSKNLLEFSRLTKTDAAANAAQFGQIISSWKIPAADASGSLDTIFAAAQKTGVPVDQLMQSMVTSGPVLREYGLGFNQATALMAGMYAAGLDDTTMMVGLRSAAAGFAKTNTPLGQGLAQTVDALKSATDPTWALNKAVDVFGTKAGPLMLDAIRSGKLDFAALADELGNAKGQILETADATKDWPEKWQELGNKVTAALSPIGLQLMDVAGSVVTQLGAIFSDPQVQANIAQFATMIGTFIGQAAAYIPILISGFFQFVSFLQNNQGIVIGILAALGYAVVAWAVTTIAAAVPAAITFVTAFWPVLLVLGLIALAAYLLYQAWINNWGGIQEKAMAVWTFLQPIFAMLIQWLQINIPIAIQALSAFWTGVLWPAILAVWGWMSSVLFPFLGALINVIGAVLGVALTALAGIAVNVLWPALQKIWSFLSANVLPILRTVGAFIRDQLVRYFGTLTNSIMLVTEWLGKVADALNNLKLPDWLTPGSPTPFEVGLRGIGDALGSLSGAALPQFEGSLALQPVGAGAISLQGGSVSAATAGGAGSPIIIQVQSDGVTDEYDIARKIGKAVDVRLRELGIR